MRTKTDIPDPALGLVKGQKHLHPYSIFKGIWPAVLHDHVLYALFMEIRPSDSRINGHAP
jgi:hypothetical protein